MVKRSVVVFSICTLTTALALSQDPPKPPAAVPGAAPQPAAPQADDAHVVAKGLIKLEMELDAVVEAAQMWPVEVKTKAWTMQSLKVIDPIEQGRVVHKGDTLVTFDTEEIDKAIRDAELAAEGAKAGVDGARNDLALLERAVAMDLAGAARVLDYAKYDLDYFNKIGRSMSEKSSAEGLKASQHNLDYAQEELKQLRKMYKEDELTEETEEIVLKRQERAVEFAKNNLEQGQERHKQFMEVTMPRRQKEVEVGLERATLDNDRAKSGLPMRVQAARQGLLKAEYALRDSNERLTQLKADRTALVVRSPGEGVVVFGRCERGRWLDGANVAASMKPEGGFRANAVFLTIVASRPVFLRSDVGEANVLRLHEGLTGWLTPTASPNDPLAVKVRSIGKLPVGAGIYDVVSDLGADNPALAPGMTGKIKLVTYEKADAIKVPLSAVKSDSPGKYHVFVKIEQGTQKREIKLGQRTATEAEVLEGLAEGDKINSKGEAK